MSKFKKEGRGGAPGVNTSSLPDIVFMLLFFFMVATTSKEVDPTVDVEQTNGVRTTDLTPYKQRSEVDFLYLGKPRNQSRASAFKMGYALSLDNVVQPTADQLYNSSFVGTWKQDKYNQKPPRTKKAASIDGDFAYLSVMERLGYRVMGLTYSESNMLGDGCGERTREIRGLSYFGVDVVKEMNRLGILVDLAHCGDATTMDAIKVSKLPCLFTHANVRSISDTSRNKTDEQIQAMAETGGVMGITALPRMVNNDLRAATIEGVLDHIDYVVEDRIAVATGGNGKAAKSADDWGWVAAQLAVNNDWDHKKKYDVASTNLAQTV